MRRKPSHEWLAFLIAFLILPLVKPSASQAKVQNELTGRDRAIYDSIADPRFDTTACFEVRPGSRWQTEIGEYEFQSGMLCFFVPVAGSPTGCLFRGKGRLNYRPPSAIERTQLKRFCEDTILDATFDEAFFRFFDTAIASGLANAVASTTPARPPHDGVIKKYDKELNRDAEFDLAARGWQMACDQGWKPPFLYARATLDDQRPLHFFLDDTQTEAIQLLQRPGGVTSSGVVDLVCSYDRNRSNDEVRARLPHLDGGLDVRQYESKIKIDGSGTMHLNVGLTCLARNDRQGVLPFTVAPKLKFDSVMIGNQKTQFIYDDEAGWILVRASQPLGVDDTLSVRFWYNGKELLDKFPWGDFYIHYTTRWLPVSAERHRATYTTTFEFPKYYNVVSVGERVADSLSGDQHWSTWRTLGPVAFISFNFGSFERLTDTIPGGPLIEIYRGTNHLDGLFTKDFKKKVAEEIKATLNLFGGLFGPYPWSHLAVTEIPGEHGQGFPQLLHLAWFSFDQEVKGVTDEFRAHEVAHQWFGHIVGWKSYHDQWLSEGFAEYAGALYLQARHKKSDEFLNFMKQLREQILEKGVFGGWHEGPQVAPIWLGYRCSSFESPASYQNLIYAKGAYILHMLRNHLYDYRTGSDARFTAMMRDYLTSLKGLDATTEDFRFITERHLQMPMGWYFDQWVYGTQIPRFEYRWDRQQQTDGRWVVKGTIDQFDTDPPFRVFMPVTLEFEGGRRTFVQEIKSGHTEFTTPPLTDRPKDVIFNDYSTILCREKVVSEP
ncbi:MAG: hypothetical protein HZB43_11580 [candidate division Zixibacteria bacterium]|nr:hypothetical protein [candidate division Zixibacteria bacterium]